MFAKFIIYSIIVVLSNNLPINYANTDTNIVITADHLTDTKHLGVKIYSDPDIDYAIYYKKNHKRKTPKINEKMYISNTYIGKVYKIDKYSFYVKVVDPSIIQYGMSGEYVYNSKNIPYGFISSFEKNIIKIIMF